ncbi:hypothetical protein [Acidithiobacillus ferridurans]|jgi:hypothetical protein|uniref:Uncharacterized protein n=1 Tax=Acidithiobacillus ferridurans TaxID=1232575 RepID=A0A2Z6ILJ1_ACIFI|nr:hypothetical protein [Acidithiobacillus ferridurans]BBF66359.1 hypothetical protein AFERRID_25770 [Acidithiobacillus ferridurans]
MNTHLQSDYSDSSEEAAPRQKPLPVRHGRARNTTGSMAFYLIDLGPFFSEPKQFLEDLRMTDFAPKGYDCSVQVAIRLMRWAQSIRLTPRQNHVMEQVVSEAIRRGTAIILSKIVAAEWSIPDHRGDHHDLAKSAATKALQHFSEKHDLSNVPHPNIATFVEVHTRFASREALEDFIYRKPMESEAKRPQDAVFSKALLERAIRQKRSELKKHTGETRQKKLRELEKLEATLHGTRTEVRLEYALEERGEHEVRGSNERLSPEDHLSIAVDDMDIDEDGDYGIPADHREFLEMLILVGKKEIAAKELIPYLVEAREYRAILGLLRVLSKAGDDIESSCLRELLGNRALTDIRKQILRVNRDDACEVVSLLDSCKAYLRGESDGYEVTLAALQVASV